MIGLRVTINQEASVVAAYEDAGQVIAMLTATGVLGRNTQPQRVGESHECWLSLRGTRRVAGGTGRVQWMRRSLRLGDRVAIEIVETDHQTTPQPESGDRQAQEGPATRMFGFMVALNDEPSVTGAADDLYVLTAVVRASGAQGHMAGPIRSDQVQDYRLLLGGLTSRRDGHGDEHLYWLNRDDLAVGDRVTIELLDATHPTVPAEKVPAR